MDEWKLVDNMTEIALENIWKQKINECIQQYIDSNIYYNNFINSPEPYQLPYPYSLIN